MVNHDHTHTHELRDAENLAKTPANGVTECPVMVRQWSKRKLRPTVLSREYRGQPYWLCCQTCADLFDVDLEHYVGAA